MSREWQPGDVALVNRMDVWMPAIKADSRSWPNGWFTAHGEAIYEGSEVRPLVVIDPEDREVVERLVSDYTERRRRINESDGRTDDMQAALREYADPKPPRIDEPGTWGVVEAACCHLADRIKWVKHEDGNWWPATVYGDNSRLNLPDDWADLVDPTLVREGVQP